jgi:hypothetical protein
MLSSKSKGIQAFIFNRLYQIHEEILSEDPEYRELGRQQRVLLDRVFASLPPEERQMLDEYDAGRTAQMNRQDELVYGQGLLDGILLGLWVERVGRGEATLAAVLKE